MTFELNNGGYLCMEQKDHDKPCQVTITRKNEPKKQYNIPPTDMIMLLNLYQHIKTNDIQNDFINPHGKNKSTNF